MACLHVDTVQSNPWYHRGQNTFCPQHHTIVLSEQDKMESYFCRAGIWGEKNM